MLGMQATFRALQTPRDCRSLSPHVYFLASCNTSFLLVFVNPRNYLV